ncbi:MAG: hypothetical protein WD715_00040 [Dongiaceae bacterium]
MPLSRRQRIGIAALLGIVLVAGIAIAFQRARDPALPDRAALETQLKAAVAGAETMAAVVDAFTADGFDCAKIAEPPGAWVCDRAATETTGDTDCPMRVTVSLLPDEADRLAHFAVAAGAYCM